MDDAVALFRRRIADLDAEGDAMGAFAMRDASGDYPSLHDAPEERQAAQDARVRAYLEATRNIDVTQLTQRFRPKA